MSGRGITRGTTVRKLETVAIFRLGIGLIESEESRVEGLSIYRGVIRLELLFVLLGRDERRD